MSDTPPVTLRVFIPGPPVPWQRAGYAKNGRKYTQKQSADYQKHVALHVLAELRKSWTSARILESAKPETRWAFDFRVTFADRRRRDIDRMANQLLDACKNVLIYDDACVDELRVSRMPHDPERPGVLMFAWVIP